MIPAIRPTRRDFRGALPIPGRKAISRGAPGSSALLRGFCLQDVSAETFRVPFSGHVYRVDRPAVRPGPRSADCRTAGRCESGSGRRGRGAGDRRQGSSPSVGRRSGCATCSTRRAVGRGSGWCGGARPSPTPARSSCATSSTTWMQAVDAAGLPLAHLLPAFGEERVEEVRATVIEDGRASSGGALSNRTKNKLLVVLHVFRRAQSVTDPRARELRRRTVDDAEVRQHGQRSPDGAGRCVRTGLPRPAPPVDGRRRPTCSQASSAVTAVEVMGDYTLRLARSSGPASRTWPRSRFTKRPARTASRRLPDFVQPDDLEPRAGVMLVGAS